MNLYLFGIVPATSFGFWHEFFGARGIPDVADVFERDKDAFFMHQKLKEVLPDGLWHKAKSCADPFEAMCQVFQIKMIPTFAKALNDFVDGKVYLEESLQILYQGSERYTNSETSPQGNSARSCTRSLRDEQQRLGGGRSRNVSPDVPQKACAASFEAVGRAWQKVLGASLELALWHFRFRRSMLELDGLQSKTESDIKDSRALFRQTRRPIEELKNYCDKWMQDESMETVSADGLRDAGVKLEALTKAIKDPLVTQRLRCRDTLDGLGRYASSKGHLGKGSSGHIELAPCPQRGEWFFKELGEAKVHRWHKLSDLLGASQCLHTNILQPLVTGSESFQKKVKGIRHSSEKLSGAIVSEDLYAEVHEALTRLADLCESFTEMLSSCEEFADSSGWPELI